MSTGCCPDAKPCADWHLLGVGTAAATALIAACGENKQTDLERPGDVQRARDRPAHRRRGRRSAARPRRSPGPDPAANYRPRGRRRPRRAAAYWSSTRTRASTTASARWRAGSPASATRRWRSICCPAQGGTATFADPAEATAALGKMPPEEVRRRPEVGNRRAAAARSGQEGRRGRLLHGRRPDLAVAGLR